MTFHGRDKFLFRFHSFNYIVISKELKMHKYPQSVNEFDLIKFNAINAKMNSFVCSERVIIKSIH